MEHVGNRPSPKEQRRLFTAMRNGTVAAGISEFRNGFERL